MKKLLHYIRAEDLTIKQFCKDNGLPYGSIRVYLYGKYQPSPRVAEKIEKATKGKVNRLEVLYPGIKLSRSGR